MPSGILSADTMFPRQEGKTQEQQMRDVTNYLYMLLEELRYTLGNLDADNFNDTGLDEIGELITKPLAVQLEDAEQNLLALQLTVQGMRLQVTNGEDSSQIELLADEAVISSQNIQFSGMVTFSDLSTSGRTVISGDNITAGTISAINITGCEITGSTFKSLLSTDHSIGGELEMYYATMSHLAGGIRLDDQGAGSASERSHRMYIYTSMANGVPFAMKLQSASGMSIAAEENIYIRADDVITIRSDSEVRIYGTKVYVNDQQIGA